MGTCLEHSRTAALAIVALLAIVAAPSRQCEAGFDIYTANFGSNSVSEVAPGGNVSTFASGPYEPTGIAVDQSGNIYVSTYFSLGGAILKFTPGGTESVLASGLGATAGMAFDSSGNLYVSVINSDQIDKITPTGSISVFASGSDHFDGPQALAFDSQGNLYVANGNGIVEVVSPSGFARPLLYFGDSNGNVDLTGLAFDSRGDLYISSLDHGNIYKYDFGTNTSTTFATGLAGPAYIAFGPDGNLYVPEYFGGTVDEITPTGAVGVYASGLPGPYGLAILPQPVPAPPTFVTLATGCFALMARLARRKIGPP